MAETMISLRGIEKIYRLGEINRTTFREDLRQIFGKRDLPLPGEGGERITGRYLRALSGIDLEVKKGECVGIIGGNGAGKSTLLKIISRITAPTRGEMDLYGRVTSMLEVGTGFHAEMTGRENIYMNGTILGMKRSEIDSVLQSIIDFSEIGDFIDTPVKHYSSGMYVKLAFSVASHLLSDIIIMDEVLAVGDIAFQKKCIDRILSEVAVSGRTVLCVSHNMNTIRQLCSRCIVMNEGRIAFDGEPEEAIRMYSGLLLGEDAVVTDLSGYVRRDKAITGALRLDTITCEQRTVRPGEKIELTMDIHAERDVPGAMMRLVVSDSYGALVGMAYSRAFDAARGRNVLTFSFDPSPLAAGSYACDVALFDYELDRQTRHDFLRKVFSFTVAETVTYFGNEWKSSNWGHVLLPVIEVTDEKRDDI